MRSFYRCPGHCSCHGISRQTEGGFWCQDATVLGTATEHRPCTLSTDLINTSSFGAGVVEMLWVFSQIFSLRSFLYSVFLTGRDSVAGLFGDRITVGARFSAYVQTGPGAHSASCIMGAGSLPGVKRPGRGVDHPPPFSAEVKERVELYPYFPSGPSWPFLGWTLPFTLFRFLLRFKHFPRIRGGLILCFNLHSQMRRYCVMKSPFPFNSGSVLNSYVPYS